MKIESRLRVSFSKFPNALVFIFFLHFFLNFANFYTLLIHNTIIYNITFSANINTHVLSSNILVNFFLLLLFFHFHWILLLTVINTDHRTMLMAHLYLNSWMILWRKGLTWVAKLEIPLFEEKGLPVFKIL